VAAPRYKMPEWIKQWKPPKQTRVAVHMRAEELRNGRRIRAHKPEIDMMQSLTGLLQQLKDPADRVEARRELKRLQATVGAGAQQSRNPRASRPTATAKPESKRPATIAKAQRGVAIPAERPVRERAVVPRTRKDQLSELDRLWDLETT